VSRFALVSGASRGIGRATALLLRDAGYTVFNLSRGSAADSGVEHIAVDLASDFGTALAARLDALLPAAADIALVHCAGFLASDDATRIDEAVLERSLRINVVAPAVLNRIVLPRMRPGSSIVFVGSTLGDKAVPGSASYVTSKHALNGLMRATCQDLAGRGIHTAVVSPGFTDTEMLRNHVGGSEDTLASIAGMSTQNRLIRPDEIAATIAFCIANPVINGAVIHANLGQIER
jgi:NAD(P)-dependent dehydrogenase (short-subunit alcohol dehydrogenase family)